MNGVNLGGWLVLEVFIAPDMFANASTVKPYRSPRMPAGVNHEGFAYACCLLPEGFRASTSTDSDSDSVS